MRLQGSMHSCDGKINGRVFRVEFFSNCIILRFEVKQVRVLVG